MRIRIDLKGCRGLFPSEDTCSRRSYHVDFRYISSRDVHGYMHSSTSYEGTGCLQNTVEWNETLYMDCLEPNAIHIKLLKSIDDRPSMVTCGAWVSVAALLSTRSEVTLRSNYLERLENHCTLLLSARVLDNVEEKTGKSDRDPVVKLQHSVLHTNLAKPSSPWHSVLCKLLPLATAFDRLKISSCLLYWIQAYTFKTYEVCLVQQCYYSHIHELLATTGMCMEAILRTSYAYMRERRDCMEDVLRQLHLVAALMYGMTHFGDSMGMDSECRRSHGDELARLIIVFRTPNPTTGPSSTSASTNWRTISRTVANDALLLTLEAIVQSTDAFPPLKSAVSGLLFFMTSADMASSNKKHIRDIHKRVNSLADSLRRGVGENSMLGLAHQEAISALATDISALKEDLEVIVTERKSRLRRFFSAKRHREELQEIVWQLDNARANYITTMATVNVTTSAQILSHVQALTLVMNASPVPLPGSRPVDAVAYQFGVNRFEEV